MKVTKEMIGAAHDLCLKKGDFVLSANLLERIFTAMLSRAESSDAGWTAYEDLRKESDKMILELRQQIATTQDKIAAFQKLGAAIDVADRIEEIALALDGFFSYERGLDPYIDELNKLAAKLKEGAA